MSLSTKLVNCDLRCHCRTRLMFLMKWAKEKFTDDSRMLTTELMTRYPEVNQKRSKDEEGKATLLHCRMEGAKISEDSFSHNRHLYPP